MNNDHLGTGAAVFGGTLLAFLLGAAVGAGVALLVAPASGEDTRKRIGEAARKLGDNVGDKVGTVKNELLTRTDDVRSAVVAGRDAYARARSTGEPAPTSSAM